MSQLEILDMALSVGLVEVKKWMDQRRQWRLHPPVGAHPASQPISDYRGNKTQIHGGVYR